MVLWEEITMNAPESTEVYLLLYSMSVGVCVRLI